MSELWRFPNPVNEKAARVVAAVVAVASAVTLISGWHWLLVPIAGGFVARVLTGPTLSPLGRLAMAVAARLGPPKHVPGPPKRFAQGIGAVCTVAAAIFALALGWTVAANLILGMMILFAGLEAAFALCVGCRIFALLIAIGAIPAATCEACSDIAAGRAY
jgi:hypothetical protein